jgi:hypothetical protein
MSILKACEECGVPRVITREYIWLDNGDIVQKREQRDRLIFSECENLDPLFQGIEDIVGSPIEHIIMDCIRRTYRSYCKLFLPSDVSEMVNKGQLDAKALDDGFVELAIPMGVGRFAFVDMRLEWDEKDFYTVSISEPNSLLMCAACHCGAMEAILGYDQWVKYVEVEPSIYNLTAFPSPHPEALKGRMKIERYTHIKGDLELERCKTCGGPKALSENRWYLNRGIVVNEKTKRRMAVMGPNQIDPIFRELELELGDTIPRVVVEAQRRFTVNGFYAMDDYNGFEDLRTGLALRGLGNLKKLEIKRTGLRMRLDNAVLQLMIVGMMQGIFDAALDTDSTVDWESSPDGDLELEVKPVKFKVPIA